MMTLTKSTGDMENRTSLFETVDEAADEIIETLDLEERVKISNLPNSDVKILQMILGQYTEKQLERYYIDETYQDLDGP